MNAVHATRRASDVNYGNRERVRGRDVSTIAWISVERAFPLTAYVSAEIQAPATLIERIRAIATIEWGHGGASLSEDYPIAGRLCVPVVGSMVSVAVRLLDVTGAVVPETVAADCVAILAPGLSIESNARWIVTSGSGGVLSERPERVVGVHGYNAGATMRWVMLFDKRVAAVAGDVPSLGRPAPGNGVPFDLAEPDGRPFFTGVVWGVSTDPLVYAPDASARVRLETGVRL